MTKAVMHPALIAYPKQAAFGRTLPKNKIYEHSGAKSRLKGLFVDQVEQVVWQYKLATETINLPATAGVTEIQIFTIQLKAPELHHDVLRCIDGAVPFPIIFELTHDAQTQVVAAYKRPNRADASRWVLSEYYSSGWLPADAVRDTIPVALNMGSLYGQMLQRLLPLALREKESLDDLFDRAEQVAVKQREVDKVAVRLAKEKQFNRKVEINAALRALKSEIETLSR